VKVTTEKLPKSLLALDIELDREQVEKGLDRAARRLSQKVNIPGFRKGKAPRFIVENYFGRHALVEEAY
jgi:trigger factor